MGECISLLLCPKVLSFFLCVGVCMNVMNVYGVGSVVQNVQCDKGLVFL
jgi:hypothetical protein